MINIEQVIKEVAKRTNIDEDIVSNICKHVFTNVVDIMKNEDDTKDILFNGLFKFKLKRRFKDNKRLKYKSR